MMLQFVQNQLLATRCSLFAGQQPTADGRPPLAISYQQSANSVQQPASAPEGSTPWPK